MATGTPGTDVWNGNMVASYDGVGSGNKKDNKITEQEFLKAVSEANGNELSDEQAKLALSWFNDMAGGEGENKSISVSELQSGAFKEKFATQLEAAANAGITLKVPLSHANTFDIMSKGKETVTKEQFKTFVRESVTNGEHISDEELDAWFEKAAAADGDPETLSKKDFYSRDHTAEPPTKPKMVLHDENGLPVVDKDGYYVKYNSTLERQNNRPLEEKTEDGKGVVLGADGKPMQPPRFGTTLQAILNSNAPDTEADKKPEEAEGDGDAKESDDDAGSTDEKLLKAVQKLVRQTELANSKADRTWLHGEDGGSTAI